MFFPFDVLILRDEDPFQFADSSEYRYVICAARQYIRDVGNRFAELLKSPYDRWTNVLVKKERQLRVG